MTLGSVTGAVLVGGRSSRMGRDKALIEVEGTPMARRVEAAMRAAGIARVIAVGPVQLAAGMESVDDEHPGEGPVGAILSALHAAGGDVLAAACDLPWLDGESLRALLTAAAKSPGADVVVARSDRLEPMCALWRASARGTVEAAFSSGERAVHRVLERLSAIEVAVSPEALHNVNEPEDLPIE